MIFLGVLAIFAVDRVRMSRRAAARRALLQVPETRIAAIKDGDKVRIRGRVLNREPLRTSPVSQRPCVGFRLVVDYRDDLGVGWQRLVEGGVWESFLLADDTGQVVLHAPFDTKLSPYRETSVESASPGLASLLGREGYPASELFVTGRRFRYVETILEPGDEIVAIGRATVEVDPAGRAPSHREPPVLCHLRGQQDEPVVLADAEAPDGVG